MKGKITRFFIPFAILTPAPPLCFLLCLFNSLSPSPFSSFSLFSFPPSLPPSHLIPLALLSSFLLPSFICLHCLYSVLFHWFHVHVGVKEFCQGGAKESTRINGGWCGALNHQTWCEGDLCHCKFCNLYQSHSSMLKTSTGVVGM